MNRPGALSSNFQLATHKRMPHTRTSYVLVTRKRLHVHVYECAVGARRQEQRTTNTEGRD